MLLRPGLTGYMLQKDLLLPWRTIADNIVLPKTLHGTRRQAALKSAVSDIAACGLRDLLNRRPDECSGGQRQRAALVRTLQTGKPLLLLDEPFGALDAITRLHLQALLTEIATKKRLTILFVTHDVDEALLLSDAILVMGTAPGRILRQYTLEEPRPAYNAGAFAARVHPRQGRNSDTAGQGGDCRCVRARSIHSPSTSGAGGC